jgi:hypothetical protein
MKKLGLGVAIFLTMMILLFQTVSASDLPEKEAPENDGPQISISGPASILRGEPLKANFLIADVSGVEMVDAYFKYPSGETKPLHLRQDHYGDPEYYVSLPTDLDTETGTYSFIIFAADIYENQGYAEFKQTVEAKYVLTLKVAPEKAEAGEAVAISGTVRYDNETLVPNDALTVKTPSGKVNVDIDSSGMYSHVMTAPKDAGKYIITVEIMSPEGKLFAASQKIEVVAAPETAAAPATEEQVPPAQETTPAETSVTPTEQQQATEQTSIETVMAEPAQPDTQAENPTQTAADTQSISAQLDVLAPVTEQQQGDLVTTAEAETSVGVASASAVFSLAGVSLWQVLSGLVFLAILVTVLVAVGWKNEKELSRRDILYRDMNTYMWQRWLKKEAPGSKLIKR